MLQVNGSFENVKEEMKQKNATLSDRIKLTKKHYRREDMMPSHARLKIEEIATLSRLYSVSKVLPVRVEGLIINHKLYADFMKKLNGFMIEITVHETMLVIQYWKKKQLHQAKGSLALYDMSKYFEGFQHIPEAVIVDEQEA